MKLDITLKAMHAILVQLKLQDVILVHLVQYVLHVLVGMHLMMDLPVMR